MMLQGEVCIRSFSQSFVPALVEEVALQIFFQTPANNVIPGAPGNTRFGRELQSDNKDIYGIYGGEVDENVTS